MDRRPRHALLIAALALSACDDDLRYQSHAATPEDLADAPDDLIDAPVYHPEPGCPGADRLPGASGCRFLWSPPQVSFRDGRPLALLIQRADPALDAQVQITGGESPEFVSLSPELPSLYLFAPPAAPLAGVEHTQHRWLTSDAALVVTALTPLALDSAGTGDATALLPAAGLGLRYVAASAPGAHGTPGFVTVTATRPDTLVTITPSAPALTGADRFPAGVSVTRALGAGQSWSLAADEGADLTGTRIQATAPVVAMSGADCALSSTSGALCDHMMTALPPIEALGTDYILPQDEAGSITFRVIAADLEANVSISDGGSARLLPGQWLALRPLAPLRLKSTAPLLIVAQDDSPQGPALAALPPLSAFGVRHRLPHAVLVIAPTSTALVIAPAGARLTGVASARVLYEVDGFQVLAVELEVDASELSADAPVGVLLRRQGRFSSALWSTGWWR